MLSTLPPELLLRCLSHLPLKDILSVSLLSTSFQSLITENENQIFWAAAIVHGFVAEASAASLDDAKGFEKSPGRWLHDVHTWKALCRSSKSCEPSLRSMIYLWLPLGHKYLALQNTWNGSPVRDQPKIFPVNEIAGCGSHVHRFKVDPVENTVIATSVRQGLKVASVDTGELLWSLPSVSWAFQQLTE